MDGIDVVLEDYTEKQGGNTDQGQRSGQNSEESKERG